MPASFAARIEHARRQMARRREEIRQAHIAGASSVHVATSLAALVDGVVAGLVRAALESQGPAAAVEFPGRIALVAVGGYGRLELAPFSDIDLLFLYQPTARALASALCEQLVRDFWDAGLSLGWSLRTPAECISLARQDISVHTALLEARLLIGSRELVASLAGQVARLTRGARCNGFLDAITAERRQEQAKYGSAVHLLAPDVKKSTGGLRELHLIRWAARARYGIAGLDDLGRAAMPAHDVATLREAHAFLLRVRNDLHFHVGRGQDSLSLPDQVRLAETFGYRDQSGQLGVERFMQHYYRHGDALAEAAERFVRSCRRQPAWAAVRRRWQTRRLGDQFVLTDGEIAPAAELLLTIVGSLEGLARLFALAREHRATVEPRIREQIRLNLGSLDSPASASACRAFLEMLAQPDHLGPVLHAMHGVGVLERLIPEFAHARGLIQFNQYHKYAVDEHTLRCVENAEKLLHDPGPLGRTYREIHHKEVLHLALLLHDLGKGFDTDHSEVGRTIAVREGERFGLTPHLREVLIFLVHQHLLMAHLAFRRDISDERVVACFARKVGTPEVLKMLFVLSAVDLQSVGPEVWTSWKADVLFELYARALELLTGDAPIPDAEQRAAAVREQIRAMLAPDIPADCLRPHLEAIPPQDLLTVPLAELAEDLRRIHTLPAGEVRIGAFYDATTRISRYTVYTFEQATPGLFSKICGVLAAKGMQILSARIRTHADGVVVDRFEVIDHDHAGEPTAARQAEIGTALRAVLLGQQSVESLFTPRFAAAQLPLPPEGYQPPKVEIDNDT